MVTVYVDNDTDSLTVSLSTYSTPLPCPW